MEILKKLTVAILKSLIKGLEPALDPVVEIDGTVSEPELLNPPPLKDRPKYTSLQKDYQEMFCFAKISKNRGWVDKVVRNYFIKFRNVYAEIADEVGIPDYVVFLIHAMEANGDLGKFKKNIANGQAWDTRTTIVPKGRGPFRSFREAAVDALLYDRFDEVKNWDLVGTLDALERYNGLGYRKRAGKISNYLWANTQYQTKGGYTYDHTWENSYWSNQTGVVAWMESMIRQGIELYGIDPDCLDVVEVEAPDITENEPRWYSVAKGEVGVKEIKGRRHNQDVLKYHRSTTLRASTDEVPWCASFVSWVLEQAGIRSRRSAWARSYQKFGTKIIEPRMGCIMGYERGDKGGSSHVGFYVGDDGNYDLILGGNQSNAVKISKYPKSKRIYMRWPLK